MVARSAREIVDGEARAPRRARAGDAEAAPRTGAPLLELGLGPALC